MPLQEIVDRLREELEVSRVTLRQECPGTTGDGVFPVTHESCDQGVGSIIGLETPSMPGQPVVLQVQAGNQVVQKDCAAEFLGDEPFHVMLELYGGMKAQIVTPIAVDGSTRGAISAHELRHIREWTHAEIALCTAAADRARAELTRGAG